MTVAALELKAQVKRKFERDGLLHILVIVALLVHGLDIVEVFAKLNQLFEQFEQLGRR